MPATDAHPIRADLPTAANRRVDHGLLAAAVGRRFSHRDEFPGLHWQQGQRHRANAIDLQQRCQQLSCPGREEVAGPANFTQYYGEVGSDHRHKACRQNANGRDRRYGKYSTPTIMSINLHPPRPAVQGCRS
jgi:hypothetical protein